MRCTGRAIRENLSRFILYGGGPNDKPIPIILANFVRAVSERERMRTKLDLRVTEFNTTTVVDTNETYRVRG